MKILIAEDDRISSLKLRKALESMGYTVDVARDGAEAWERVLQGGAELLISDWMMPKMDGIELCRLIRARDDSFYTYVILLTARDSREDRLEGLAAGADDFLTKPVDHGELVARLNVARRILAMQGQLRAHAEQLAGLRDALEKQNVLLGQQNVLLAERATTDGLTGLRNRRYFDEALREALSFAGRQGTPLSLLLLDVDHFKAYNDSFGHQAGDEALQSVADTLRSSARAHDVVARFGGEEFALLLPATDAHGARAVAERIRSAVADNQDPHRPITASLGIATTSLPLPGAARLIEEADQALYHSKSRGRDRATHHLELVPNSTMAGSGR